MNEYVIIGNGVAAAGCIEGIRSADKQGKITVVSGEEHAVYCRPLISYYLEGKTDQAKIGYRDEGFYSSTGCEVRYGRKAVEIDPRAREVILDDGSRISYTSLCVAAGSSPFVPPFEGLETVDEVFSFMTLDDAQSLKKAVNERSRVLIVGAGLIGLKCAEGLHDLAGSITVCDLADRVLSSILDADGARLVQKHMESYGIRFLLGDSASRFEHDKAFMQSGKTVKFDILVLAVGVRANTALLKRFEGTVGRGIITDSRSATIIPDIFAAGDCTECPDISSGQCRVLALMPNAYMQGHAAGVNMAGGGERFDKAIPMNSIGFFGMHIMTAGSYDGDVYEEKRDDILKRFFTRNDRLVGFMLIGAIERAGIYTSLIREQTPLSEIDFELLKKIASLAAFSPEARRNKLGKVV